MLYKIQQVIELKKTIKKIKIKIKVDTKQSRVPPKKKKKNYISRKPI